MSQHTESSVGHANLPFRHQVVDAEGYAMTWHGIDRSDIISLDRNEVIRPLPPSVVQALIEHVTNSGVYLYPDAQRIIGPLSQYCNVPPDYLLTTNGSDHAIDLVVRTFVDNGSRVVLARPGFSVFDNMIGLAGGRIVGVDYSTDLDFPYSEFKQAVESSDPALVVLINPNNPTGTPIDVDFIGRILSNHPNVPVIVDEAYYEFTKVTVADWTQSHENLIVLRTFSKAFSMAGIRLGYIVANPATLRQIAKLRNPFDVNSLAITAGIAQLAAVESVHADAAMLMQTTKPMVIDFLDGAGMKVWPGAANFVVVKPSDCESVVDFLRSVGILVRPLGGPLLEGCFRMSIGRPVDMTRFIEAIEQYLRSE